MTDFTLVAETDKFAVVGEYVPPPRDGELLYESEAQLEKRFIEILEGQGYEYLPIHTEADLVANLRRRLEALNGFTFSESEWERFFQEFFANERLTVQDKAETIQEDFVKVLRRDDGTFRNVKLLDKSVIHNNCLQVINQYEADGGRNRYDVTILVNGIPLVHCELKRRGVAIREAFNQIRRYANESFWSGTGLFGFVQIFVISNGTHTKYYSNTTRFKKCNEEQRAAMSRNGTAARKSSNSFEFTSWWADGRNRTIEDLADFARTFFAKHTLLAILTRYSIWTSERELMVMRPYQIAATERILQKIVLATNNHLEGTVEGGGYVWHTTGSGKTLTSFRTATLAAKMPEVDKVLFVVDRSDLDYQTMHEYNKFQKDCVNGSSSTRELVANLQLTDPTKKITVTTIQKLGVFISKVKLGDPGSEVFRQRCVLIFDECHRSQFGELHQKIVKAFRRYHLFGFTGTPIFSVNAGAGNPFARTTEQVFGKQLHAYTIVDAIRDGNVLPFHIETVNTIKAKEDAPDREVAGIDRESALLHPNRISSVVSYILSHFNEKTKRNRVAFSLKDRRINGFNSMFAVSSIPAARAYYDEFLRQMNDENRIRVATIFTYSANEDDPEDGSLDAGGDPGELDASSRDFLEKAISHYNAIFRTNFSTDGESFQNYYKDLSLRIKNREVDLVIVVNMFLTGFDATTLNTLWVDKNLRMHGLIQAFSRTNRILNSVKTFGNIICFRDLQKETEAALALFGDKEACGLALVKTYGEYLNGYTNEKGEKVPGWLELVHELLAQFPLENPIVGEQSERAFISLYGRVLKLRNILGAFDEFAEREDISERDFQDYQSRYIDLHDKWRPARGGEKESIADDVEFEMELVRQIDVNIDYILLLVAKYRKEHVPKAEMRAAVDRALGGSVALRSKRELVRRFVESVDALEGDIPTSWTSFVSEEKTRDIDALVTEEKLKPELTKSFFDKALEKGVLRTDGTDIDALLPPMSRFGGGNGAARAAKKQKVVAALAALHDRYAGLSFAPAAPQKSAIASTAPALTSPVEQPSIAQSGRERTPAAPRYDVFISYRREGGQNEASYLASKLEGLEFKCFFDHDSLKGGDFTLGIRDAIEKSSHVVVMVTDGAFDRCGDPDDFVRLEIEQAFALGKKIIPVCPSGNARQIPDAIPESIRALRTLQIAELKSVGDPSGYNLFLAELFRNYFDPMTVEVVFVRWLRRLRSSDDRIDEDESQKLNEIAEKLAIRHDRYNALRLKVESEFTKGK